MAPGGILETLRPAVFPGAGALTGEAFGDALARSGLPVVCHCDPESEAAARDYLEIVGCRHARVEVHRGGVDLQGLERDAAAGPVRIVVLPALDPNLKDRFFHHPRLHLFADHHYLPCDDHESPRLFTVGTALTGMERLLDAPVRPSRRLRSRRCERMRARYGAGVFGYDRVGDVLRSRAVEEVRIHGLGPPGTNISRACRLLAREEAVEDKASIVIHARKVEPLEYAEIAAREERAGVLPLHVECAVYYRLADLFETRRTEVVFATHLYMALDEMQLACRPSLDLDEVRRGPLVVASHPSPLGLVRPLLESGALTHLAASSNSDAAEMVRLGEAELCITTGAGRRRSGLRTLHSFGSPTMLFTAAASASNRLLRSYLP